MVDFKTLVQGAKIVGMIILAFIGVYAVAMIGGIIIGVLTTVAAGSWNGSTGGGAINLSDAMKTATQGYEGDYISTVSTALTANPTIAALVIIVVLVLIFFGSRGFGFGKDSGVN